MPREAGEFARVYSRLEGNCKTMANMVSYRPELGSQRVVTSENVRSLDCRDLIFLFFLRHQQQQQQQQLLHSPLLLEQPSTSTDSPAQKAAETTS